MAQYVTQLSLSCSALLAVGSYVSPSPLTTTDWCITLVTKIAQSERIWFSSEILSEV